MGIVRLSTLVSLVDQGPLRFALNSRAMLGRGRSCAPWRTATGSAPLRVPVAGTPQEVAHVFNATAREVNYGHQHPSDHSCGLTRPRWWRVRILSLAPVACPPALYLSTGPLASGTGAGRSGPSASPGGEPPLGELTQSEGESNVEAASGDAPEWARGVAAQRCSGQTTRSYRPRASGWVSRHPPPRTRPSW